jgi:hypothetical protein
MRVLAEEFLNGEHSGACLGNLRIEEIHIFLTIYSAEHAKRVEQGGCFIKKTKFHVAGNSLPISRICRDSS